MSDWRETTTTHDDETISLLHDEIARLEAELRAQADSRIADDTTATWDAYHNFDELEPFREKIDQLGIELSAKEETIHLLLEQTRFYEDAAAVQRAEWDELQRWVEEVERRFGADPKDETRHREELDVERKRSENLRSHNDTERQGWETRRREMEQEIGRLRAQAAQTPGGEALAALEQENRALREHCERLEAQLDQAPDVESLRKKLEETYAKFDAAEVAHRRAGDEWAHEKNELIAALNAARGEISREAPKVQSSLSDGIDPVAKSAAIEADQRIRAFREHLQELHAREANERANRGGLSARLSRLWNHGSS